MRVAAVDIGNTRAKFGIFTVSGSGRATALRIDARVLSETPDLSHAFLQWWHDCEGPAAECVMVAGSDPDLRDDLTARWPLPSCPPQIISSYQQIPVRPDVDFPDRVGIDRLLNVFAAVGFRRSDCPVIVVDSGTATTVDLMTSDGIFRGGSILPGLRLSARAMHDYTARLPLLNVDESRADLPALPGRNTESAMLAGLFLGQLGAVREIANRLQTAAKEQFSQTQTAELLVTGGGGRQLADHLPNATFVDSLALHGLAALAVQAGK